MYRFIFVDDEELLRKNLPYMTDWSTLGFEFAGSFSDITSALDYIKNNKVDFVLSDIKLETESGLDLAKILMEEYPSVLVALISAYKEFEFAKQAIKYHVFSYLTKPTSYNDIIELFQSAKETLDARISSEKPDKNSKDSANTKAIEKAILYINEHFREDITRHGVAEVVDMNPEYFSRYFKKHTDKKFVDYINELRINHAKKLLAETNLKVYEICSQCSYKSMHYFLTLFKQYTNMTPNEYRTIHFGSGERKREE